MLPEPVHARSCTNTHFHMCTCLHTHTSTCARAYTHTSTCACVYTVTHTSTCAHAYTHTVTHASPWCGLSPSPHRVWLAGKRSAQFCGSCPECGLWASSKTEEGPGGTPPAPPPRRSSPSAQDFAKQQLLIVLEYGDCDAGSCLQAISVSLGDILVQLRDSGSPSSQGPRLPGLLHPTALRSGLLPSPLSPWTPPLSSTFCPRRPVVPEPKFSS